MKTTKEKIEIMQAYERGEQIQINNSNNIWEDIETPIWDWVNCNYRVKPKNLDKLISAETGMPVYVAEEPLDCVVKGTEKTLQDLEKLKTILLNSRKRR